MKAFRYELPLVRPMSWGGKLHSTRQGLLLLTEQGWGDAAPLPGFSRETIEDVVLAWRRGPPFRHPSIQFALDSASQPTQAVDVPVNALLTGPSDQILGQAGELANTACRAIKLKVGRSTSLDHEIEMVWRVREALRKDQLLRLDANRAWDTPTAIEFGRGLTGCAIEYIEEPLRDPTMLEEFFRETSMPYALDETLTEEQTTVAFANAAALICKPTMLGGLQRLRELAAEGKRLVFSASFESGVGIARIAQWSSEFSPEDPVGLDTYGWLANDVLAVKLERHDWRLSVPPRLQVDRSRLVELKS